MLSDYFYCGILAGGAMLGVGQLARAIPRDREIDEDARGLAVLVAALAEGLGVLAIVIGLLSLLLADDAGGLAAAAIVLIPAVILGVPGLWMLNPLVELASVRSFLVLLGAYMAGLGILTLVVALLALLLESGSGAADGDLLVMALGAIGAAAAAGIGYFGAQGLRAMTGEDRPGTGSVDAAAVRSGVLVRAGALTAVGVGTAVITLYLFLLE